MMADNAFENGLEPAALAAHREHWVQAMRMTLRVLMALAALLWVAGPVAGAPGAAFVLRTPSYLITIRVLCEEGVVDCDDIEYMGVNKRTGASIQLKGKDWIRYCEEDQGDGPGRTPCQHLGYKFVHGSTVYYVGEDGDLEVLQGKRRLLHEAGEWDRGQ